MSGGAALLSIVALGAEPAATSPVQPRVSSAASMEPAVDTARTEPARNTAATSANDGVAGKAPTSPTTGAAASRGTAANGARVVQDRLELDATQITGNRELPRVMYVVPWKRADLGDLSSRPVRSLLDEVLSPVDRDVFQRQNHYYEALRPDVAKVAP
jgi:hypothetical protein